MAQKLGITDVVLRDAHQSLLATRFRLEDMLPIAPKLDEVGFWSLESWGGATFDACIRYLGEDPWERIRAFKKAMPKTPQQMLLRGQNLLGYRHYADDVVHKFIERCAENGVDVFRVFDAMNYTPNLETAVKAVIASGGHAQTCLSYTTSPVHTMDNWLAMARRLEDMGSHSLCIKDMAGLLTPYYAEELVTRLKETVGVPIHMQCHATTGLSVATIVKAAEAGIDNVDTAISSMSMTYGHSPTETIVAIMGETERDTGLDLGLLEEIAAYFRKVRARYAKFEGGLRGVDARILTAQAPGGMLTNLENQLRAQNASERLDEVMEEIPRVRKDLGYLPLVTPTSQIVCTQAVFNVLDGERYKTLSKESTGVLRGEYGQTPAPVDGELRARALDGDEPVTSRPADHLEPELDRLLGEFEEKVARENISLTGAKEDNLLIYAMFPQVGWQFLANRGNPDAFEAPPDGQSPPAGAAPAQKAGGLYKVVVEGRPFTVEVLGEGGARAAPAPSPAAAGARENHIPSPLAGNIFKVLAAPGQSVSAGQPLIVLEAMKMETTVSAPREGTVGEIFVAEGDKVENGTPLLALD